ncbi:MAG: allantoicase, partial [Flavobacteriaceae bacterium]
MLDPAPPIFAEGRYDDHGKWMDGWESRRKRVEGFDHAVI